MASTFTTADEELITLLARAADGRAYREQKSPKADGLFPSVGGLPLTELALVTVGLMVLSRAAARR